MTDGRKFIQISVAARGNDRILYALDEAGEVWELDWNRRKWVRAPMERELPREKELPRERELQRGRELPRERALPRERDLPRERELPGEQELPMGKEVLLEHRESPARFPFFRRARRRTSPPHEVSAPKQTGMVRIPDEPVSPRIEAVKTYLGRRFRDVQDPPEIQNRAFDGFHTISLHTEQGGAFVELSYTWLEEIPVSEMSMQLERLNLVDQLRRPGTLRIVLKTSGVEVIPR